MTLRNAFLTTIVFVIALVGCTPTPTDGSFEVWYVAIDGDDANVCNSPTTPCATITEGIAQAAAGDKVEIAAGLYSEYDTTVTAALYINKDIWLMGTGVGYVTLDGRDETAVVMIREGADVIIENFRIRNGGSIVGHGIDINEGTLSLRNSVVRNNAEAGILMWQPSSLSLENVKIRGNQGEGILQRETNPETSSDEFILTILNSEIFENQGAGVVNFGEMSVTDTRIDGNGSVVRTGSTDFVYDQGSGIDNRAGAVALIERSTISHGSKHEGDPIGAGIYNLGQMTLINSTVSGNEGFGIRSAGPDGELSLQYTTVAFNRFGLYVSGGQPLEIGNALIANNSDQDCDILGAVITWPGVVLDSDQSCVRWASSDREDVPIPLEPLANYGGETETHALLFDSLAVNAATGDCPPTDQRGVARTDGSCDVGSYEFELVMTEADIEVDEAPEVIAPTPTMTPTPTPEPVSRCSLFDGENASLVLFDIPANTTNLELYVLFPHPVWGPEEAVQGDDQPWEYSATLGSTNAQSCDYLGYTGRVYCDFSLPEAALGATLELDLFVNLCTEPIFTHPAVGIIEPEEDQNDGGGGNQNACQPDISKSACEDLGYNYDMATKTCLCP
jgi:hypothetical protein